MTEYNNKKTILHIVECLGSGVLNYIKNLTAWQIDDFNIVIAYSTRPETPPNFKELFDERIDFIKVNGFTREIEPINDIRAFANIKKIVTNVHPDLIHLHSTKAGVIGRWAISSSKYKIIYSPHAYSFLMADCNSFKRNLYRYIEKISDRKECLTIADSTGEMRASELVALHSMCIENGIDIKELADSIELANKLKTKNSKSTICMSGKVVAQKNPPLFNEIAQKCPEFDFLWIGSGSQEKELSSPNIKITGWLERTEALALILSSDIFVFTSLWESLSIALLEAMYMRKPCVVSNCDGNKDVIQNGINGFLCDSADDYAENIRRLITDKPLAAEIGENARKAVENIYNTSVMQKKYRELFVALGVSSDNE